VAEIDGKFRTLRSRHTRAIAGLSMGGYGALKIALRYHDDFAFAGSLSGALNAPQDLGDKKPEFRDQLVRVFGPPGSTARADNNVFSLLQSVGQKDPAHSGPFPQPRQHQPARPAQIETVVSRSGQEGRNEFGSDQFHRGRTDRLEPASHLILEFAAGLSGH
jgi:S-formylglutathione hydrolase FrmB